MPRYHIWTIGCQMNKAESERLASLLEGKNYIASSAAEADIIVLNSCVVRQSAEARVVNKLKALRPLKAARPGVTVVLTGCMVNSDTGQLTEAYPHVDYFCKPGCYPDWVAGPAAGRLPLPSRPAPSVFVPIIEGCNNFCSYCIVPYRRGRERSRPVLDIRAEVEELVCGGAREITLLGQNVDSYGHDLPDKPDLADLLGELNEIAGLARIRFLTNHPKDMSLKLIDAIARLDKVCEQVSLPAQSGDDAILKAMKRGYTVEQYHGLVREIKSRVPGIALSTDIIVGFPGETDGQFEHTVGLLTELRFDTVHVAAYSPRPGTSASRECEDDVPPAEKMARLGQVERLQERVAAEINSELLGKTIEVLVEDRYKGKWRGRTRTGKLVFFSHAADCRGLLVMVKIEKTSPWSLQGNMVSNGKIKEEK